MAAALIGPLAGAVLLLALDAIGYTIYQSSTPPEGSGDIESLP